MWIYGIHPVRELLGGGKRRTRRVVLRDDLRKPVAAEIGILARRRGIRVEGMSRTAFESRFAGHRSQGVVAEVFERDPMDLSDLLEIPGKQGQSALFLLIDGVEDPRNLGAIIRSAEAAGVHGVVLPARRSAPLGETAARASAGAVDVVDIAVVPNIKHAISAMQEQGIAVVGAEAGKGVFPWRIDLTGNLAIVVGGEGRGVRPTVLSRCDAVASLPQLGRLNSLNVSVAAGMLLYEVARQRTVGQDA